MKKPMTKAELEKRLKHMEAQLAHNYHFADNSLNKVSTDKLMGSGVILELTFYNGGAAIPPVMIKDGLSAETIAAIRADLRRSYELAIQFAPKART